MLTLEESSRKYKSAGSLSSSTALTAQTMTSNDAPPPSKPDASPDQSVDFGRGNDGRGRGRGGGRGRGRGRGTNGQQQQPPQAPGWPPYGFPSGWQWPSTPWSAPPCPFPTQQAPGAGILGAHPRPQQAFTAFPGYTPTDLANYMSTVSLQQPDNSWYMDTSASSHMTNQPSMLSSPLYKSSHSSIIVGKENHIPITGSGNAVLPTPNHTPLKLSRVLVAPNIIKNLISVRQFTIDNNASVEFDPNGFSVKDLPTGTHRMRCDSSGALYPFTTINNTAPIPTALVTATSVLHARLGHPGTPVFQFLRSKVFNSSFKVYNTISCRACQLGKHVKLPFFESTNRTYAPFDIIHSDLWTSPIVSEDGFKYYVFFIDDYTNFLWVFPIRYKSQVFDLFVHFHAFVKTQFNRLIKTFQCDNGREFDNNQFHTFFQTNGISFRFSCPYTSSQNGKAERTIRTINNMMRTLLLHAHIPSIFWPHALTMSSYLLNILPSSSINFLTPTHLLYNRAPSYDHLRVFGCLCYPNLTSTSHHKLSPRSTPCVFLGYPSNHRGYKCFDLQNNRVIISRHVMFNETRFPFSEPLSVPTSEDDPLLYTHLFP